MHIVTAKGRRTTLRAHDYIVFHLKDGTVSLGRGRQLGGRTLLFDGAEKQFLEILPINRATACAIARLVAVSCGLVIKPMKDMSPRCAAFWFYDMKKPAQKK